MNLAAALRAARRDARPLVESEPGGKIRRTRDPSEHWWYYAPSAAVGEEATRLFRLHGLELEWCGTRIGTRGQIRSRWRLTHTESGETRDYVWEAPPFPDAETATHAVLGTVRHAERSVRLLVLQIPLVARSTHEPERRGGETQQAGGSEPGDAESTAEESVLDRLVGEAPAWMTPTAQSTAAPAAVHAAATRWRGRMGKDSAALFAAAGLPPASGTLPNNHLCALREFLKREGDWKDDHDKV